MLFGMFSKHFFMLSLSSISHFFLYSIFFYFVVSFACIGIHCDMSKSYVTSAAKLLHVKEEKKHRAKLWALFREHRKLCKWHDVRQKEKNKKSCSSSEPHIKFILSYYDANVIAYSESTSSGLFRYQMMFPVINYVFMWTGWNETTNQSITRVQKRHTYIQIY